MQVRRLQKEDYSQLIGLLNYVFTLHNKREMDFEKELPKMCVQDDENMQKHLGVFESGKLVAVLGAYPLKAKVLEEELLVYTVGNIATHPEFEGKGYMQALLTRAMQELDEKGADISRLGGIRQRYERFGYEPCGMIYEFRLTGENVQRVFQSEEEICFEEITREDRENLKIASELLKKEKFYVERKEENSYFEMYASMTAWRNKPYIAKMGNKILGYLCVSPNGSNIAECFAYGKEEMITMLCGWQRRIGQTVSFGFQPHRIEHIRWATSVCQNVSIVIPSQFKIVNFEKTANAFIKLKASDTELPKGELKIYIENYGGLRLYVDENGAGCEKYNGECDISLTALEATRYLFGPLPPETVANANTTATAWLPLPLSWNLQDRV